MALPPSSRFPAPDFRLLFESAPGLYLVLTPEFEIVAASDAYLRATMTRREDIVGRALFDVFPDNPRDSQATGTANLRASLERVRAERRPDAMAVQKYDIRRPESEGGGFEERFWSPVNSPVFGPDGRIVFLLHRVEDVTEFVRLRNAGTAERQLTEELRTRTGAMEAEIVQRAQEIQAANRQLRELQAELEQRVRTRTSDLERANEELQRQVAERRKAEAALGRSEEQLRQAQKMEAVGRLAGGIAHDFNNMLSVILSYSEVLMMSHPEGSEGHHEANEIRLAGRRAAELTRQLLTFSRQQILEPTILDLNEVLGSLTGMLTRVLGEDVELRLVTGSDLGRVKADRGQIEQVVMNLAVNARDAMPGGGRLTVETSNADLDAEYAEDHLGAAPGRYVVLTVSDTGVGMDRATQARVFEPFFTTKERGKGTGLGLSTVFGIVQQSGGTIWLYSEVGSGTTFKIYLPMAEGNARASRPRASAPAPLRGSETILLVEDEEQVRSVAVRILRRAGYNVLEARTPAEAIELAERHAGPIELLATDVVMPKMNGRDLSERVRVRRPGIRVLFMSGYTDDVILHHGVLDPGVAILQKPLTPEALGRKVREVLDERPEDRAAA